MWKAPRGLLPPACNIPTLTLPSFVPPGVTSNKGGPRRGHALRSMCRLRLRAAPSGQNGGPRRAAGPLGKGRARKRAEFSQYLAETEFRVLCEDAFPPDAPPPLSEGALFRSLAGYLSAWSIPALTLPGLAPRGVTSNKGGPQAAFRSATAAQRRHLARRSSPADVQQNRRRTPCGCCAIRKSPSRRVFFILPYRKLIPTPPNAKREGPAHRAFSHSAFVRA